MAKKKILVVEDEPIIATEIKERLEALNYTVTNIITSKEHAIDAVKKERPNLVLMDIMLGNEMAGFGLSKIIHDEFDIPVVFLTAYSDEETLQRAKLTEPYGYILKPIVERELRSTIEIALYKYGSVEDFQFHVATQGILISIYLSVYFPDDSNPGNSV